MPHPRFAYPVFLDLADKSCLVIGGGRVAERKVTSLLSAGAVVTVVSPRITTGLKKLLSGGRVKHIRRAYKDGDISTPRPPYTIAVVAANSEETNRIAAKEAMAAGIQVNVVDRPSMCSFIVPAVVRRGPLAVAISTSAKTPYFAKALRKTLEEAIPEELGKFTELLGAVRSKLAKTGLDMDKKEGIYAKFLDSKLVGWIRDGSAGEIDYFLKRLLGPGYTLKKLGIDIRTGKKKTQ